MVSHSQVEEWISGSFIQSHWPCMTLWPISMFSRILAADRHTHSGNPGRWERAREQCQPPGDGEPPLGADHLADVGSVLGTEGFFDIPPDRIEFRPERLDVRLAQMRVLPYVGNRHE